MPINRRQFLAGSAGLGTVSFLLAACGSSGSSPNASTSGSAAGGGADSTKLVEAVAGLPTGFSFDTSPIGYENMEFSNNVHACLIRNPYVQSKRTATALEQDLYKFEGVLAKSYDVSADGLVYTFHLRDGVTSPQGNPLTADDVLWSYERKWNSTSVTPFVSAPAIIKPSQQFKKLDAKTVQITVGQKSDGFTLLSLLANVTGEIYDSVYLKSVATKSDPYGLTVSNAKGNFGFGAYTLESFTPGQQLILKSNPNFALGAPTITEVTQRVVADAGTRANVLKNGDVDLAVQLRPADIATFAKGSGVDTFEVDTNQYTWITLQTTTAPFNDVKVREALTYAIPYDKIIQNVYKGRADPMRGFLNPSAPGYSSTDLVYPAYDAAKSKSLLAEAGHKSIDFDLLIPNTVPDLEEIGVQIRSVASAAGFNVTIQKVPAATFSAQQGSGKYQALMVRDMAISQSPPYELLLEFTKGSPLNTGKWENADFYAATNKGIAAGDPLSAAAGTAWNEAEQIIQSQVPQISIARVQPLMGLRSNVHGFAHRSDNIIDFSIIKKS